MKDATLLLFWMLCTIAIICSIVASFVASSLDRVEGRIIARYREKIDKIPALIEVIRKYAKADRAYKEFIELHRKAIVSAADRIYDILELNSHISNRFAFLMRLALQIRGTSHDGNFITVRESITRSEGQIRELIMEHNRITRLYNRIISARNATLVGALFPGSKKILVDRRVPRA